MCCSSGSHQHLAQRAGRVWLSAAQKMPARWKKRRSTARVYTDSQDNRVPLVCARVVHPRCARVNYPHVAYTTMPRPWLPRLYYRGVTNGVVASHSFNGNLFFSFGARCSFARCLLKFAKKLCSVDNMKWKYISVWNGRNPWPTEKVIVVWYFCIW